MLGAAANGLHRGPRVAVTREQVPACGRELIGLDPASGIGRLRSAVAAICQDRGPDLIPIPLDNGVGAAEFDSLFRI